MKNKIVNWIKDYSEKSNLNCLIIGISGGVDSALTSTLCAETGIKTIVVSMPIHQNENELLRARNHIDWLSSKYDNVESVEIPLSHIYEDFGVGFFTKYGDGGVDISPIADLMKSQVIELAKQVGVSDEITNAAPTDGLWEDSRTDEEQIGATYEELEWAMTSTDDVMDLTKRQIEVLRIYEKFNKQNKHKMVPIPVCKIGE